MSLAATSTETGRLIRFARRCASAAAAGITVVVAAGNFGQSSTGLEVYGAIGAPGNDRA